MTEEESYLWKFILFMLLIFITGTEVNGDSLDTDREALLNLKSFLENNNQVNRKDYAQWNQQTSNPCAWPGVLCTPDESRVNGITLRANSIDGRLYTNFSSLTALTHLDLSQNTLNGPIPDDLNNCRNLVHLNLSHNLLDGELNFTGLNNLQILDLYLNRFSGGIQFSHCANRKAGPAVMSPNIYNTCDGNIVYINLTERKLEFGGK